MYELRSRFLRDLEIPPDDGGMMGPGARTLAAAFVYFLAMLTAGWIVSPIGEFYLRQGVDRLATSLAEASMMSLAALYASGWSVRSLGVPPRAVDRLFVGVFAALLLLAGGLVGGALSGDFQSTVARAGSEGWILAPFLCLAAILPLLRSRRAGRRG